MKTWGWSLLVSVLLHVALLTQLPLFAHPLPAPKSPPVFLKVSLRAAVRPVSAVQPKPQKKQELPLALKSPIVPKEQKKETVSKERMIQKTNSGKPQKEVLKKNTDIPSLSQISNSEITRAEEGEKGNPGTGENSTAGSVSNERDLNAVLEMKELHVVRKTPPDYPLMSRKRMEEGTVILIVSIEKDRVTHLSVEKSSGHARLDQAAQTAVRSWRFAGTVGAVRARIPISFVLN